MIFATLFTESKHTIRNTKPNIRKLVWRFVGMG